MSTYLVSSPWCSIRAAVAVLAVLAVAALLASPKAAAQGCVVARGSSCTFHLPGLELRPTHGWTAQAGYRWFKSDRHFVGDHEETHRQEEGSEVINDSHFVDFSLTYAFTPRWSAQLVVPFVFHDRSQVVRSNDVNRTILQRYSTQSSGLADIRVTGFGWVMDPAAPRKWNVQLGLGVDMPTGDKDATDTFQVFDPASGQIVARERTVDQSIQPGDGGWGIVLNLYSYWLLTDRLNLFAAGSYMMTPEENNGVRTYRTNPYEQIMSIADSYFGQVGAEYTVWKERGVNLSLAGRIEGVPVYDAFGGSEDFRRPGLSIAIEPGISASRKGWAAAVSAPVALYRNRERSVPDKQSTEATGVFRHGDAAFADYSIVATVGKMF